MTARVDPDQHRGQRHLRAVEDRALAARFDRGKGARWGRRLLSVDHEHALAGEDHVELDLATAGLIVGWYLTARADLDQVVAEGLGPERFPGQHPGRVARALHALEIGAVLDRVTAPHPASTLTPLICRVDLEA